MSPRTILPLASGFNPQSLPDAVPPVPGARSWQWLAEQANDPAEQAVNQWHSDRLAHRIGSDVPPPPPTELVSYLEHAVAGFGTTDPTARRLALRPLPREQVIASHLQQDVVIPFDGAPHVTVRLSAAAPDEANGPFPFPCPVAVIGTVPPTALAVQALGRDLREDLQAHFDGLRIGHRQAVAADRDRRWAEQTLIVDYTDAEAVRFAAQLHLQPFLTVWRWQDGRSVLDVIDLAGWQQEQVVATGYASLGQLAHRPCPMIPGAGSADLCRMPGGPWTSRSIAASSRWETKRTRMIRALGCDTCGDGAIKVFPGRRVVDGARNTHTVRPDAGSQSRHDELAAAEDDA